ncbi:hypothetical protein A2U01_0024260 [Trifolium medium]|uniref:Uncharacterized protein n=1 Tax=Trifolium medium TaxID=97028 RepID=A0A392NXL5_9FABA|nr:hypothetical protein [Trifolium medium]
MGTKEKVPPKEVDGSPRELWGSAGMEMEEEYSLKREIETRMGNILDDEASSRKVSSA